LRDIATSEDDDDGDGATGDEVDDAGNGATGDGATGFDDDYGEGATGDNDYDDDDGDDGDGTERRNNQIEARSLTFMCGMKKRNSNLIDQINGVLFTVG
jgi:hypothetical protein